MAVAVANAVLRDQLDRLSDAEYRTDLGRQPGLEPRNLVTGARGRCRYSAVTALFARLVGRPSGEGAAYGFLASSE
jgi:hypothetical protein